MNTMQLNMGEYVAGEFIIKNPQSRTTNNNNIFQMFEIILDTLPIRVIAWADSCTSIMHLCHGQTISLKGQFEQFFGNRQVRCTSIKIKQNHQDKTTQAKVRLKAMMGWMPDATLQEFMFRLFKDEEFYNDFSTAPANLNHHHSYIGGLFVHSVDVAWQVFRDQSISENDRYLGAIAGLLHDAGKIRTFSKMTRTSQLLHHDLLSLEVLSVHLNWLDQQNSDLATALRYLLAWKPTSYDPIPKLDVYEKVRAADRVSAGSG